MDLLYLQALNSQLQALIQQRRREFEIIEISEKMIKIISKIIQENINKTQQRKTK